MTRAVWRAGLDASKNVLSSDDQGWPRVSTPAQPVALDSEIQGDKGASRRQQARCGGNIDMSAVLCRSGLQVWFRRDGFGQSGKAIHNSAKERDVSESVTDTVSMSARHALKVTMIGRSNLRPNLLKIRLVGRSSPTV